MGWVDAGTVVGVVVGVAFVEAVAHRSNFHRLHSNPWLCY